MDIWQVSLFDQSHAFTVSSFSTIIIFSSFCTSCGVLGSIIVYLTFGFCCLILHLQNKESAAWISQSQQATPLSCSMTALGQLLLTQYARIMEDSPNSQPISCALIQTAYCQAALCTDSVAGAHDAHCPPLLYNCWNRV